MFIIIDFLYYFSSSHIVINNSINFIAIYVKLKILVTGLTISRIPKIEARMQTKSEYDVHWHIYLVIGLLLGIALWLIWEN